MAQRRRKSPKGDVDIYSLEPTITEPDKEAYFSPNVEFNKRIMLWTGDITTIKADAIVNAANERMRGGGGIDGAIHRAAGKSLLAECIQVGGCPTGEARLTGAGNLPCRWVIHTVGPMWEDEQALTNCYNSVMELVRKHKMKSVVFCCISTGIYGYDNKAAAKVALRTVRQWMNNNEDDAMKIKKICFCMFMEKDLAIYKTLISKFFPEPAEGTCFFSVDGVDKSPNGDGVGNGYHRQNDNDDDDDEEL